MTSHDDTTDPIADDQTPSSSAPSQRPISKPIIEPMLRKKQRNPSAAERARTHKKRPDTPPHRDAPKKARPQPIYWDCIKALPKYQEATCTAFREDVAPGLSVWRLVLAVKLPKGVSNRLKPTEATPIYNLPLLACGLLGAGWRSPEIKGAFLLRGPERGEDLLVIKTMNEADALELVAQFDPDRAVALFEAIQGQQGRSIVVQEPSRETAPNSHHLVFGPGIAKPHT